MESHLALIGLTAILVLGYLAQWLAGRLRIPSILLLLLAGLTAGPLTGFFDADDLFDEKLLLAIVSLSVAVILYEGGLSLRLRELHGSSGVLLMLTTVGALITGLVTTLAARWALGFEWPLAALLGSILVVTGPTVIGPLLLHIRPTGAVASILKWEGIIIDPIGAMLAVLVSQAVLASAGHSPTEEVIVNFVRTLVVGSALGVAGAALLLVPLARYWIPDALHNTASLATLALVMTLADVLQSESGLLAVTLMGIILANQKRVPIKHIVDFKENLRVLLISSLFIMLASRLELEDLTGLGVEDAVFLLVLIVVARPAAVLVSCCRSKLSWAERAFLAWMAPRGIVAASVSSVFALRLLQTGFPNPHRLVTETFLVIIATVALYGLTAAPLARRLGLSQQDPQGLLIVGGQPWARELAAALQGQGCTVKLADTNWSNIGFARMKGLDTYYGSVLSEHADQEIELPGIGRLLAVTSNDEVNSLACLRYLEFLGRREVYQLPLAGAEGRHQAMTPEQRGRLLFGADLTYVRLTRLFGTEPVIKATRMTAEFDFAAWQAANPKGLPLFTITEKGKVTVATVDQPLAPKAGQTLLWLAVTE